MRYLILLLPLLAACGGSDQTPVVISPPPVLASPDLFETCDGWTGPPPATERDLLLAAQAEIAGRRCANAKIEALAQTYGAPQ